MVAVMQQLLALVALAAVSCSALTMQVENKQVECFFHQLEAKETFKMQYEVIRGGLLDIKLRVHDPNGGIITEKLAFFNRKDQALNDAEGRLRFVATVPGVHKICFDNSMSRWTAKVVSYTADEDTIAESHEELAKLEDLGPVVDSVIKISDDLDRLEKVQHHMRVREQVHRDKAETTNGRVSWMAIVESVLLLSINFFQLKYIRQWFNDSEMRARV